MADYSFCETPYAGPLAPWHIRRLDGDQPRPGGGMQGETLCGRQLNGGWDISGATVVLDELVEDMARPNGDRIACAGCVDALKGEEETR